MDIVGYAIGAAIIIAAFLSAVSGTPDKSGPPS